jgi:hypothetical protein
MFRIAPSPAGLILRAQWLGLLHHLGLLAMHHEVLCGIGWMEFKNSLNISLIACYEGFATSWCPRKEDAAARAMWRPSRQRQRVPLTSLQM